MRWLSQLNENIKRGIRSWLNVLPANPYQIQITEVMDFELNAIRNRIWYRGDGNELEQLYRQSAEFADRYKFWASRCTPGMEIRKIHTGLPALMVKVLTAIVLADMNDFNFDSGKQETLWKEIEKRNRFRGKMKQVLREVLYIGDGAWKITANTRKSPYPVMQWYSGDRIEFIYEGDDLQEIVFKTPFKEEGRIYVLNEHYGYGYIRNCLYQGDQKTEMSSAERTRGISDWKFDDSVILAVPLKVYESSKWEGRGGSIFDGKQDAFDAFDEVWSQWMDALRAGRARTYIPESLVPRNPSTGEILSPNPFDNRFFAGDDNMAEGAGNKVQTEQPSIPHDSYLASYVTALDLCLQGIISPSTLGIDVKKLDNAEAQREKEKTTLYTRNAIVEALQETLPELITACLNCCSLLQNQTIEKVKVDIPFGEYANPSFESQVETLAKARPGVPMMSIEAQVEELYGDSRDEKWKSEEIKRLKAEQGVAEMEEPSINQEAGSFRVNLEGGNQDAGEGDEPGIPNEP